MNFSEALEALKMGARVARAGWNGKGMWLFLVKGKFGGPSLGFKAGMQPEYGHLSTIDGISLGMFEAVSNDDMAVVLPRIGMRTAGGSILHGWLASQTDMLAEDWVHLEPDAEPIGPETDDLPCNTYSSAHDIPFKPGELVSLKSGQFPMTVIYADLASVEVAWSEHGGICHNAFPRDAVRSYDHAEGF